MSEGHSLEDYFGDMPDPRVVGRCDHKLIDIITIGVCGVLCGAEGREDIEELGQSKENWLREFLELPCGIPSHDTFRRVFSLMDATAFQERFADWVAGVFTVKRGQVVAFDGKTLRGSQDEGNGKKALHLVSAGASASGLLLGQRKVAEKSNKITAIPELLKQLYVEGGIVSIDAMGCQKDIARTIIEAKADYVLALKGNQGQLHEDVQEWFAWAQQTAFKDMPHTFWQTTNKAHGRIEIRRCWALSDPRAFEVIRHHDGWAGLQSIARVQRERRMDDPVQSETAFFISSLPADAKLLLHAVRAHWSVENTFHWTLDVTSREDDARLRSGASAENFAVLRHISLNLLKHHPAKLSLKRKRFKAALDHNFLLALLSQF
jgi:predicted transposase YbfD/YdcC